MTRNRLVLQLLISTQVALGSLLMGVGEQSHRLSFVIFIAAYLSVYITDIKDWFKLNARVANLAALMSVLFSLSRFKSLDSEEWIFGVAHLLTYLELVMFFQEKNQRINWLLIILSLLQVAVAAALSLDIMFGIVLVVYLVVAITVLSLYFVQREFFLFKNLSRRRTGQISAEEDEPYQTPTLKRKNTVESGACIDPTYLQASRPIFLRVSTFTILTLIVTGVFFFAFPRIGFTRWQSPPGVQQNSVGFSDDVRLGEMGEALQNPANVVRLSLTDFDSGEAIQVPAAYLRGSVLIKYMNQRWWRHPNKPKRDFQAIPPGGGLKNKFIQTIEVEPLRNTNLLFSIYPYAPFPGRNDLYFTSGMVIERGPTLSNHRITYDLLGWGDEIYGPGAVIKNYGLSNNRPDERYLYHGRAVQGEFELMLQMPPQDGKNSLEKVIELANEVSDDLPIELDQSVPGEFFSNMDKYRFQYELLPKENVIKVANQLSDYLRVNGGYQYSLKLSRQDLTVDPIEDFLLNHKKGHCEYFASSLALMLRAKGIPSRVITGFAGGEWNSLGEFYQFKQLHAHAWVEAYLPGGHWLILDATSSDARETTAEYHSTSIIPESLKQFTSQCEFLWSKFVLGMDTKRQREAIFRPIIKFIKRVFDPKAWSAFFGEIKTFFQNLTWDYFKGNWFNWYGGLIAFGMCWVLVGTVLFGRRLWRRYFGNSTSQLRTISRRESEIAFYRQFESILGSEKWVRSHRQTPKEFAADVIEDYSNKTADSDSKKQFNRSVTFIVEQYYEVRFGGKSFDQDLKEKVSQTLNELKNHLRQLVSDDQKQPTT